MTDPNTTSLTTNPQDLINQALGTTPLPTPEPLQPEAPAPEVTSPPATPQVELASEIEQTPTENVTAESVHKPSVEEMPLAFANTTQVQEPIITSAPIEPATTIPPVMTTPLPEVPKKTAGTAKTMVNLFVGLLALFGIMSGVGYYAYQTYGTINPTTIAAVQNDIEDSCNGCTCDTEGCGGGWKRWDKKTQSCKVTGICNSGKPDKDTEDPNVSEAESANSSTACTAASGIWCDSIDSTGVRYSFCISNTSDQGCNLAAVDRGYTITYGASWRTQQDSTFKYFCKCATGDFYFDKPGVCNNLSVTKDAGTGEYNPNFVHKEDGTPLGKPNQDGSVYDYDKWGLCGVVKNYNPNDNGGYLSDYNDCFVCTNTSCTIKTSDPKCGACKVIKYTCDSRKTGISCLEGGTDPANSAASSGKCGTVEQIDVACGALGYIQSRTILNKDCEDKVEEVDNGTHKVCDTTTYQCKTVAGSGVDSCSSDADCMPTLMCSGLTQNPTTTPKIGDNILFTCTGTTVPAGAVKLSYDYRYQIDGGAWKQMATDKSTNPKGTLTVAACGSYKVQCRVCGTINGAQVCDPTWIGATQQ